MPAIRTTEPEPKCTVVQRHLPREGFHYHQSHVTIACGCGFTYEGWGTDAIAGFHVRNLCPVSTGVTYTLAIESALLP